MPARILDADAFAKVFAEVPGSPDHWLLAVSGGPDSTAMMYAAARWAAARGVKGPVVATVDHGLRAASREEARGVVAAAAALGLDHEILPWADRESRSVSQEAARTARYRLLATDAARRGRSVLLTAHTIDDQAETVLMRLAAGSGPAGLAGMKSLSRRAGLLHARPFLTFRKIDLVATCVREGWSFAEDPSNADERFERVRWRGLMPDLAREGADAACLSRFAGRMRRCDEALAAVAAAVLTRCRMNDATMPVLDLRLLGAEPDEIVIRVVAAALLETDPEPIRRLDRLETCAILLKGAALSGRVLRRTLAGRLLSLDRVGLLTIEPEPKRFRGRAVTTDVAGAPHSLGIGPQRA